MFRIVVLSSSGGGNFLNLAEHAAENGYRITRLIADRDCGAIAKAAENRIAWCRLDRKSPSFDCALLSCIPADTDLIASCGYLSAIKDPVLGRWKGKIINSHPSLLPKYGGKGMYGVKVHEAVMRAKETYTGCTTHYVDGGIDTGKIILQKRIPIDDSWTPWELGGRVYLEEKKLYLETIRKIMAERGA